jgi:hypothetical protein
MMNDDDGSKKQEAARCLAYLFTQSHQKEHLAMATKKQRTQIRPSETLRVLGGWSGGTIGQAEALAGINVQDPDERKALWDQFRHLYAGPGQVVIDAVMDHCATITLSRIKRGELSLLPRRY